MKPGTGYGSLGYPRQPDRDPAPEYNQALRRSAPGQTSPFCAGCGAPFRSLREKCEYCGRLHPAAFRSILRCGTADNDINTLVSL